MPAKLKAKKQQGGGDKTKTHGGKKSASMSSRMSGSEGVLASTNLTAQQRAVQLSVGLSSDEVAFLTDYVSFSFVPPTNCKGNVRKEYEGQYIAKAAEALLQFHMCVLHDALLPDDLSAIEAEYAELLDTKHGAHAIGEKDSSKRSGTRMWNCPCQLGPNCSFQGWRGGSERTRQALQHGGTRGLDGTPLWRAVCDVFGFSHIARVEVVTSHVGCRKQDWHCDSAHGLTVIFALVDIDLAKGPTEIEFTTPFNSLGHAASAASAKIKCRHSAAPESVHAVLPRGSVLLFNANANHRGTANLSSSDRPILVLDTSPACTHLEGTCWGEAALLLSHRPDD